MYVCLYVCMYVCMFVCIHTTLISKHLILFQDLGNSLSRTVGQRGDEVLIEVHDDSGLDHPQRRQDLSCSCAMPGLEEARRLEKKRHVLWQKSMVCSGYTKHEKPWCTNPVAIKKTCFIKSCHSSIVLLRYQMTDPSDQILDIPGGSCISEAENVIFVGMHWEGTLQLDHTYNGRRSTGRQRCGNW